MAVAKEYECVFIYAFETGKEAKAGIGKWLAYYNTECPTPGTEY